MVTGGTGFTGSHLAAKLHGRGDEVRLLVRDPSRLSDDVTERYGVVAGDIRDKTAVDRATRGVDIVFHVAAVYRTAGMADRVYREVHVVGTENLISASHRNGVSRFVHCSTVGVHGHIENGPANENHPFNPGDIYQATKLDGERLVREYSRLTGMEISIIRPCAIYGPGDMRLFKLFKLAARDVVPILGSGDIRYHMVYIDDLIDAFVLAAETEAAAGEVFIIGGSETKTLNELVDCIARITNHKPIKIHLPAKPFQLLGDICERIFIPLKIEPPIYRRRVDFFTKSRSFDISKAREQLGYAPRVDLASGLRKTAEWYKDCQLL